MIIIYLSNFIIVNVLCTCVSLDKHRRINSVNEFILVESSLLPHCVCSIMQIGFGKREETKERAKVFVCFSPFPFCKKHDKTRGSRSITSVLRSALVSVFVNGWRCFDKELKGIPSFSQDMNRR